MLVNTKPYQALPIYGCQEKFLCELKQRKEFPTNPELAKLWF